MENLLQFKKNAYSQNGEDGIIEEIFRRLGISSGSCCEFGAWDGIHFSNTRNLILKGWIGVMIEGDKEKFQALVENYKSNDKVHCFSDLVDYSKNTLGNIFDRNGLSGLKLSIDFLCIDIDGFDYYIFKYLDIDPKVICVEVNAGHNPESEKELDEDIAQKNIGQPFTVFTKLANARGYELVVYSGNAFYVKSDLVSRYNLPVLSPKEAYLNFLESLTFKEKRWLCFVNLGLVEPFYNYNNHFLTRRGLSIPFASYVIDLIKLGLRKLIRHQK